MIILRYLNREILASTLVIATALLLFSIGQRFAQYLDEAWRGDLAPEVLFIILAYRIPEFLTLILPISFFMGTLYALGRLYVENEMVVLSSCGVSQTRILLYCLVSALGVAAVVAFLAIVVSPLGLQKSEEIKERQKQRSELELLAPNRFQRLSGGKAITYFQQFNQARDKIENVFIAEMASSNHTETQQLFVLTAKEGEDWTDPATQQRYLLLHDGFQYIGTPGEANYRELQFASYGYYLESREPELGRSDIIETYTFAQLRASDMPKQRAELQWRIGLALMVIIVTIIAVPMSYTSPRQGRFFKMLPAFFLLVVYLGLLVISKGWIATEKISPAVGLWWVHGLYLAFAMFLLWWNNGQPNGRWGLKQVVASQLRQVKVTRA